MLKVFFLTAFHVSIGLTISPTFLPSANIRSGQVTAVTVSSDAEEPIGASTLF